MTAIAYNPIGAGEEFTAKLLDANFKAISEYTKNIELEMFKMAGVIEALAKRPNEVVVKLPKNRKLFIFAVGVAAGVYIYKNRQKINVVLENVYLNDEAKQQFTSPIKDAEWTTQTQAEKDNSRKDVGSADIRGNSDL